MKKILLLFVAIAMYSINTFAQSTCATSTALPALTGGGTHNETGTTIVDGSGGGIGDAFTVRDAAWFSFTPAECGTIDVASCLGGADTRLYIHDNCAGPSIANNDDACDTGGGQNYASQVTGTAVTGGTTYYIEWDDRWELGPFDWDITFTPAGVPVCPTLDAPANGAIDQAQNVTLSWTAAATGATADSYDVYLGTTSGSLSLVSNETGTTYATSGLTLGTTYYWYVNPVNCNGPVDCSATEFSFTVLNLACDPPTGTAASAVTATTATVSWTDGAGCLSDKIVTVTPAIAGSPFSVPCGTQTLNLTGLSAITSYSVEVANDCGANPSETISFSTLYAPCASSILLETFDGGALPAGWSNDGAWEFDCATAGGPAYGAAGICDYTGNAGGAAHVDFSFVAGGSEESLTSPSICAENLGTLNYSLFSDNTNDAVLNTLYVEISSDEGATWTTLNTISMNGGWMNFSEDLSAYTAAAPYSVRFRAVASAGNDYYNDYVLDNICMSGTASTACCQAPIASTASSITATSADITWTDGPGCITTKTVTVTPAIAGSPFSVACGTQTLSLTGLSSETTYTVDVANDCGASPSATVMFTTPCAAVTPCYNTDFSTFLPNCWEEANAGDASTGPTGLGTGAWGGSGTLARINLWNVGDSDWLLTPEFDLSAGGYQLVLGTSAHNFSNTATFGGMGSDDTVEILISTDGGTSWTVIHTIDASSAPTVAVSDVVVDLSAYTGTSNLFGIRGYEGTVDDPEDYYFNVHDFEICTPPACAEPTMLTATGIMAAQADLGWTENNSPAATAWDIELGTAGFTATGTPTAMGVSNPYTAMSLTSNTSYDYYVRADCGGGTTSSWAGPFTFTTLCSPAELVGDLQTDPIVVASLPYNDMGTTASCYTNTIGNGSNDVFYQFTTSACATDITISLCNSSYDTYLRLLDASGTELSANDDNFPNCGSASSYLTYSISPSTTYFAVVEGFGTNNGAYEIDITETMGTCVATGTVGMCTSGAAAVMVPGTGGAGVWIDIVDGSGNIIASIEDTENLGMCTADFYTHADGNRIDGDMQNYMGRNITINPTTQPVGAVKVRLYYLDAEYTALQAATETTNTTTTAADLLITKYPSAACSNSHSALTGAVLVPNSTQGTAANGAYLETSVTSFSEFFMHETGDGSPLPVEFVSFTGQAEGKVNVLDWETASEINNSHFEVERSANGEDFVNIGRVEGNGNSTVAITYDFTDNAPLDIAYYRLKQVDYDGEYDYSNVITIVRATKTIAIGNVRPNPTKGSATIQFNSTQNAQLNLVITNVDGKVVANRTITAAEGINNTEIDLSGMANGVYFLSLGDNETRVSTRIVKAD